MPVANTFSKIIKAGLLVGSFDICAALINFYIRTNKNPAIVLQYIASALLGKSAYNGGFTVLLSGLALHYAVAFLFTAFLFFLRKNLPVMNHFKVTTAIVYSTFMWATMRYLVLPLTHVEMRPEKFTNVLIEISILFVCISLPLLYLFKPTQKNNAS